LHRGSLARPLAPATKHSEVACREPGRAGTRQPNNPYVSRPEEWRRACDSSHPIATAATLRPSTAPAAAPAARPLPRRPPPVTTHDAAMFDTNGRGGEVDQLEGFFGNMEQLHSRRGEWHRDRLRQLLRPRAIPTLLFPA
jgi:hypothetical protein